ncbi:Cytochrome P450 2U1 [Hondaea fermentalgiana]|uniref:Cytochrome P450 2U1 n=1 Tax=Hondaea fermentalgiana TaxID=2315210 RepID=A0A2R5G829_9STRA|nr:Cytochrome P450 2U1 [Hondaea fermentalgiana]|eukprot:GBG27216.1 Cytochrome P450 2U1 [Hondaea fermentalgiana]
MFAHVARAEGRHALRGLRLKSTAAAAAAAATATPATPAKAAGGQGETKRVIPLQEAPGLGWWGPLYQVLYGSAETGRLAYERLTQAYDRIIEITEKEVRELFAQEEMPDCWFKDLRDEQNVSIRQLEHLMSHLFSVAIGTTMTALQWAIIALALHPQEQAKVYAEIQSVLAGTTLVPATTYENRDTLLNADANEFRPDRFLRENLRASKGCPFASKMTSSMTKDPFGNGSRVCLGKRAAELEIRMLISSKRASSRAVDRKRSRQQQQQQQLQEEEEEKEGEK